MERSWLETVQSLGLDVQFGIILLLIALDGLVGLVRRVAARRAARTRRVPATGSWRRQPAVKDSEAWPPDAWRAGGGATR